MNSKLFKEKNNAGMAENNQDAGNTQNEGGQPCTE